MKLRTLLGLDRASTKLADGSRVHLRPLTLKQTLVIEQAFAPIAEDMAEHGMEDLEVYSRNADDLIKVVAVAVGQKVEKVEAWQYEDFKKVLAKLLDINRNFFTALVVRGAARAAIKKSPTGD